MNKIAVYLSQHLSGEVSSAQSLRKLYATDGGILSIAPEIVAFPRVTNDIRKVARFTWQLAEKGHTVGVTVRGYGGDVTGAAIGKGIVVEAGRPLTRIAGGLESKHLTQLFRLEGPGLISRSETDRLLGHKHSFGPGRFQHSFGHRG